MTVDRRCRRTSMIAGLRRAAQRVCCLLGRPECSDRDPCPVHGQWKATAEQISAFFRDTTVADVIGAGSLR